jgi:hypothetical protein
MSGGSYRGTAVPPVGGISYGSYSQPANWQDPSVTGQDLVVQRDVLRQVASEISALAGELQGAISGWRGLASDATAAVGAWPEAQQLGAGIGRSSSGFGQYSGELRQAHSDTGTRIRISADRYDATEQANVSLANASNDPSATIVEGGGNNVPVDPGYGKNWTPAQQEAYARTQRLINMTGGQEVWTGTFPITEDAAFLQAGTAQYTWQEVQSLLGATDPGAISAAGAAYGQLSNKLTDVASKVAGYGHTLAGNWGGSTAVTAVSQVQQLYQTAADMQANAWQAQHALTWYGSVLSAFKTNLPQPASSHPADVAAANQAATARMAALNGHIQTAYNAMPGAVNKNLPPPLGGTGGGNRPATAGTAGGSGGGLTGGAGSPAGAGGGPAGSSGSGAPGAGSFPSPGSTPSPGTGTAPSPGSVPVPTSHLAGVGPGPGGTAPGPPGGSPPGGSPGGVPGGSTPGGPGGVVPPTVPGGPSPGGDGTVPGDGAVPGGGAVPGDGAVPGGGAFPGGSGPGGESGDPLPGGPGGLASSEPGAAAGDPPGFGAGGPGGPGAPGETSASTALDSARLPMGGSPGGGAAGSEMDRVRDSWTTEDDGTWGSEGGGPGGPGEAGDPFFMPVGPGGNGQGREQDRLRQAWMAEDDDLWGALEPAVPPVIGA